MSEKFSENIKPQVTLPIEHDESRQITFLTKEAQKLQPGKEIDALKQTMKEVDIKEKMIKQAVIKEVCRINPEIAADFDAVRKLTDRLNEINQPNFTGDRKDIERQLNEKYADIFEYFNTVQLTLHGRDRIGVSRRLQQWVGRSSSSTKLIKDITDDLQNPEFSWHYLMKEGVVSPEIVGEMGNLALLFEAHHKMQVIGDSEIDSNQKKAMIAELGLEMEKKGLPAELFVEALIDPEVFGPHFLGQIVGTYLNIQEELTNKNSAKTVPIKVARAIVLTVLSGGFLLSGSTTPVPSSPELYQVALPLVMNNYGLPTQPNNESLPQPSAPIPPPFPNIKISPYPPPGLSPDERDELPKPSSLSPDQSEGKQAQEQSTDEQSSRNPEDSNPETPSSKNDRKVQKPRNDSLTSSENDPLSSQTEWKITGDSIPQGYFRDATTSSWDHFDRAWVYDTGILNTISSDYRLQTTKTLFQINNDFSVSAGEEVNIDLPVADGFVPNPNSIKIKSSEGVIATDYSLLIYDDGTYGLRIRNSPVSGKLNFQIGFVEENKDNKLPNDLSWESFWMGLNVDILPKDVQKVFEEAVLKQKNGVSDIEVARYLGDWIKNNFTYSNDPKFSDYYDVANQEEEYWNRIFKERRTDCDVANTALVALLRNLGIQSKLGLGYYNQDDGGLGELSRLEKHGWTEVFDSQGRQQKIIVDATPTKKDSFTKNERGEGSYNDPILGSPLRIFQALKDRLLSERLFLKSFWGGDYPIVGMPPVDILWYALARTGLYLWARRNNESYNFSLMKFDGFLYEATKHKGGTKYYSDMHDLIKEDLKPQEQKRIDKRLLRFGANTLIFPGIVGNIRKTIDIYEMNKRIVDTKDRFKSDPAETILAQVAGKTVDQVVEKIEDKNEMRIKKSLSKSAIRALKVSLQKGKLLESNSSFIINLEFALRNTKTMDEFYQKILKQAYLVVLTDKFPRSRIWERHQEIGGSKNLHFSISQDALQKLLAYWEISRGGII